MIVVDAAQRSDLPALVALLQLLFEQEREFTPAPEKQWRGLELILDAPGTGQILVAREDGRVAGMVSLLFSVSTALGERVCWLEDMIVHPEARSGGIGTQLITHALDYARSHGYARVSLLTDDTNSDARRFYARHGFAHSDMVTMRHLIAKPTHK